MSNTVFIKYTQKNNLGWPLIVVSAEGRLEWFESNFEDSLI